MSCQQGELYEAERHVPMGRRFESEEELQAYVDELPVKLRRWRSDFPEVVRVEAFVRSDNAKSSVGKFERSKRAGVIDMLPVHMNELFVLHEVSHVLAEARYGSKSHDPWFAHVYLELVYSAMGSDAYLALYEAFEEHGIDHQIDD